ncbi:MAG: 30S ribosomal protein S12 methylthiotransferase RimO [Lachnospiraceae bacterium]
MKILFVSLGCDKNLVDTETMIGLLQDKGYVITNEEDDADVAIVNSCCFIGDAKEESIETIIELGKRKETGKLKSLIVTGCLAQRYKDEILKELPEVDAIIGTMSIESIGQAVEASLMKKGYTHFDDINYLPKNYDKRVLASGTYMGYLKIAEGCNKRCTYCIIPSVRGKFRSIPLEEVMKQARNLVDNGVTELCLVAQETTLYGLDLYGKKSLPMLLQKLSTIENLKWIRLLYCYPEEITDELIMEIKNNPKVCHYIDMPLQHCENRILKRMGRATTKEEIIERIRYIRKEIPDIVLRTTLIAGFPGETKEDHTALLEFIDEVEFNRLGVFTYSPEEDTPAAGFDGQIDEDTKVKWRDEIMELQQEISYDLNAAMVGKTMEVIVDGYVYKDDMYMCRSYMDAPDIDGMVFVHSEEALISGDFITVKITDFNEYDLIGEII